MKEHIYNSIAFERLDYTYDSAGLVNSLDRAGVSPLLPGFWNSTYDKANRHFSTEAIDTPDYDANGNMTDWGDNTYTWDQSNRLVRVTGTPEGTVDYTYDALNRRTRKIVNGVSTYYLYDGLNLVAELDSSGDALAWYVYSLSVDEPLARISNSGDVRYYHTDILGSIVALTNSSGASVTQYNYSPFGVTQVIGEDLDQPFRFTGREWDSELAMYYYRARYYSPTLARFITEDPIRYQSGDVNWYRYVNNNPINNIDPLGWAYIGSRPINGIASILAPIGVLHYQIFLEKGYKVFDMDNIGFFSATDELFGPGKYDRDNLSNYNSFFKKDLCDSVMVDAIKQVMASWSSIYNVLTNNCQHFVIAVLKKYEELMQ